MSTPVVLNPFLSTPSFGGGLGGSHRDGETATTEIRVSVPRPVKCGDHSF